MSGQVNDLGDQVIGDEHAVAVAIGNLGQDFVVGSVDELNVALFVVLTGAHLEGDEAVAAQLEGIGGQGAAHGRVTADGTGKIELAGLLHHCAADLFIGNQTADVKSCVLTGPAGPLAELVLSFKIAVGDVGGNLLTAACSQAQNHAQRQQQGKKLFNLHSFRPLPIRFLIK